MGEVVSLNAYNRGSKSISTSTLPTPMPVRVPASEAVLTETVHTIVSIIKKGSAAHALAKEFLENSPRPDETTVALKMLEDARHELLLQAFEKPR